ncbi:MAG: uracil-DNA glycosylase family protein [Candidatus Dormibacteria bacterium]
MPDPGLTAAERQVRLDAIASQVAACRLCPLHLTRILGVPGSGPGSATLMAVGEAPGEREDQEGLPFVGAAGQLLTELLEGIGLGRQDIFITNVLKSRPPGNRDPLPEEVDACAGYLDEQIAVIEPKVILILGRHALQRLLPGAPWISRCHGQLMRVGERTYMPCYHPAAALYNGSLKAVLIEDFKRLGHHLDELRQTRAVGSAAPPASRPPSAEQLGLF